MKIMIIGSGGMLGHMVTTYLDEKGYDIVDVSKSKKCREQSILMDVTNIGAFSEFLSQNVFDAVVNCAALLPAMCTNVQEAIKLNSLFPHILEDSLRKNGTYVIQISSGGVYKGDSAPYDENSEQDSSLFYGKTKSLGEINGPNSFVIRSDIMGPDMNVKAGGIFNWAMTSSGEISGYSHMSINGVLSLEYAKFIELAIKNRFTGAYNLHSDGSIAKADFLRLLFKIFGKKDVIVKNVPNPIRNNSLSTVRYEIPYINKSYEEQLVELKQWMIEHKHLYPHYKEI